MVSSSFSQDEKTRLAVLRRFEGIDASPEAALDSITALVAWFFNAPISVIDLILHDRIIVKSLYGLEKAQVGRQAEWRADAIATRPASQTAYRAAEARVAPGRRRSGNPDRRQGHRRHQPPSSNRTQ
jgi:hypothetical protein